MVFEIELGIASSDLHHHRLDGIGWWRYGGQIDSTTALMELVVGDSNGAYAVMIDKNRHLTASCVTSVKISSRLELHVVLATVDPICGSLAISPGASFLNSRNWFTFVSMANMISLCFLAAALPCKVRAVGEVGLSRALNRSVPDPHAPNFTQLHYRLICISSDLRSVCLHQSIKRMII
jgi:hypothetical protein